MYFFFIRFLFSKIHTILYAVDYIMQVIINNTHFIISRWHTCSNDPLVIISYSFIYKGVNKLIIDYTMLYIFIIVTNFI